MTIVYLGVKSEVEAIHQQIVFESPAERDHFNKRRICRCFDGKTKFRVS